MVDLGSEEEPCATASLHVAVNKQARVVGMTKSGSSGMDPSLAQVGLDTAAEGGGWGLVPLCTILYRSLIGASSLRVESGNTPGCINPAS